MRDLGNHPAHFPRVHPLRDAMHLAESEGAQCLAHLDRAADAAADLANANLACLRLGFRLTGRAHASPSAFSSFKPRSCLYSASLRSCLRASNVAFTTL